MFFFFFGFLVNDIVFVFRGMLEIYSFTKIIRERDNLKKKNYLVLVYMKYCEENFSLFLYRYYYYERIVLLFALIFLGVREI